ncbi:hypothetical protein GCM10029978_080110 [Actinoallomurus acanthiterrae]
MYPHKGVGPCEIAGEHGGRQETHETNDRPVPPRQRYAEDGHPRIDLRRTFNPHANKL